MSTFTHRITTSDDVSVLQPLIATASQEASPRQFAEGCWKQRPLHRKGVTNSRAANGPVAPVSINEHVRTVRHRRKVVHYDG